MKKQGASPKKVRGHDGHEHSALPAEKKKALNAAAKKHLKARGDTSLSPDKKKHGHLSLSEQRARKLEKARNAAQKHREQSPDNSGAHGGSHHFEFVSQDGREREMHVSHSGMAGGMVVSPSPAEVGSAEKKRFGDRSPGGQLENDKQLIHERDAKWREKRERDAMARARAFQGLAVVKADGGDVVDVAPKHVRSSSADGRLDILPAIAPNAMPPKDARDDTAIQQLEDFFKIKNADKPPAGNKRQQFNGDGKEMVRVRFKDSFNNRNYVGTYGTFKFYDDDATDPTSEEQDNNAAGVGGTRNRRGERVGSGVKLKRVVIKADKDGSYRSVPIDQVDFLQSPQLGSRLRFLNTL